MDPDLGDSQSAMAPYKQPKLKRNELVVLAVALAVFVCLSYYLFGVKGINLDPPHKPPIKAAI